MYLTEDIKSFMSKGKNKLEGRKGDKVKVLSGEGAVRIVEGPDGNRFSVASTELTDIQPKKAKETIPVEPVIAKAEPFIAPVEKATETPIINKQPAKKQKPVAQIPTLF